MAVAALVLLASSWTSLSSRNPITINVWTYWSRPFFQTIEKQFDASHSGVRLTFTPIPIPASAGTGSYSLFTAKLTTAEVSGTQPNLIAEDQTSLGAWAQKGLIQPISPYLKSLHVSSSQFPRTDWNSFSYHGKEYGVPIDWDPDNMLFYNVGLMQKAGISHPPTTFDQLWSDAKAETVKDGSRYTTMGFVPWAGFAYNDVGWAHMYGGTPITASGRVTLDSKAMVKSETWEQKWARAYGPVATNEFLTSLPNGADPFAEGKLGFMVDGDWELGVIGAGAPQFAYGKDWKVTTAPVPSGGKPDYLASGWGWTVPKKASHLSQTMEVLRFLTSARINREWCGDLGWLPANNKTLASATASLTKQYPGFAPFIRERETHPDLIPELATAAGSETVATELAKIEDQVEYLKGSPAQVLASAQSSAAQGG